MNKTDAKAAFPDLKILCVSGENIFALNSKNAVVLTSAQKDDENVICGNVTELSLNAQAVVGEETVEIPVDEIVAAATADYAELKKNCEEAEKQRDSALANLAKMQKEEKERRLAELKNVLNAKCSELESVCGVSIDSEAFAKLTSDECLARYCEMEDAEGKYCGLSAALRDLKGAFIDEQEKHAKLSANSKVSWNMLRADAATEETDDFDKIVKEINR